MCIDVRIQAGGPAVVFMFLNLSLNVVVVTLQVVDTRHVFYLYEARCVNLVDLAHCLLLREAVKDIDCKGLHAKIAEGELHQADIIGLQPRLVLSFEFFDVRDEMDWVDVVPEGVELFCCLAVPVSPVERRNHVQYKKYPVNQKTRLVHHLVVHADLLNDATDLNDGDQQN